MQDLTRGAIRGHIARYGAFMFATMLFQTLYFLVDLYFVSGLGSAPVAAVSVAGNMMFMVMALTQALSVGTTTLVSHAFGAGDMPATQRIFNQAQLLALLCGLVLGSIAFALRGRYAAAFTADAETAQLAVQYLNWFLPAMLLQFPLTTMAAALRGAGEVKIPSLIQVLTLLLNIALAPVLVAGWGTGVPLGVAGAGLATLISVAAGTVLLLMFVLRPQQQKLRFGPRQFARPDFKLWQRIAAIGLPSGGEFALMAVFLAVVYTVLTDVGVSAQAGFGVGLRVMQSIFLPAMAVSFALAPIAGQNFGARQPERVRETLRSGLIAVSVLMFALSLLSYFAGGNLAALFLDDPAAIAVAREFLGIASFNFVPTGIIFCCAGLFQALGNTLPSLAASALRILAFAIPALWIGAQPWFETRQLWFLSAGSVILQMLLAALLLRRELRIKLADMPAAEPVAAEQVA
ncbi:MATE family efflux transporter [Microbulbifer sp. SAOS-129_SWC]|uniref:MATE family efflux transporter n=1 Tax=Microbulbifer sp. SAOS-129_SWC TaxID=3145235 RepID=UPI003216AC7C